VISARANQCFWKLIYIEVEQHAHWQREEAGTGGEALSARGFMALRGHTKFPRRTMPIT
jgi:hypothetical protein